MKINVFLLAGCILFCRPHGAAAHATDPPSVWTNPPSVVTDAPSVVTDAPAVMTDPPYVVTSIRNGSIIEKGGLVKRGEETGEAADSIDLRLCCEKIAKQGRQIWYLADRNGKMQLQIRGIYTHGAAMFFLLRLSNHSSLDYDIDSVRFLITGYGRGRAAVRNSSAAKRLSPVYVHDCTSVVPGFSKAASIFVLRRFTLLAGRQLLIEVQEKNGGRHLRIGVYNWTLERARII